jgi:hypothetical protein
LSGSIKITTRAVLSLLLSETFNFFKILTYENKTFAFFCASCTDALLELQTKRKQGYNSPDGRFL